MAEAKYNRIKAVLAERGVTSKELANKLGISEGAVSTWCRNFKQPTVETLFDIARILNVDVRSLLHVEG